VTRRRSIAGEVGRSRKRTIRDPSRGMALFSQRRGITERRQTRRDVLRNLRSSRNPRFDEEARSVRPARRADSRARIEAHSLKSLARDFLAPSSGVPLVRLQRRVSPAKWQEFLNGLCGTIEKPSLGERSGRDKDDESGSGGLSLTERGLRPSALMGVSHRVKLRRRLIRIGLSDRDLRSDTDADSGSKITENRSNETSEETNGGE